MDSVSGEHNEEEIFSAPTEEYPAVQQMVAVAEVSDVEGSIPGTTAMSTRKVKSLIALAVFLALSGIATAVGVTMANRASSVEEAANVAAPAAGDGEDEVKSDTSYLRPKEEQNVIISEVHHSSKSSKPTHHSSKSSKPESTKSAKPKHSSAKSAKASSTKSSKASHASAHAQTSVGGGWVMEEVGSMSMSMSMAVTPFEKEEEESSVLIGSMSMPDNIVQQEHGEDGPQFGRRQYN